MRTCGEPGFVERLAHRADAPVHHVGGGDDVAAGLGLHHRLAAQDRHGLVILDIAVADHPVMAVRGERVERHVAQHAEIGQRFFQRGDRAADEIAGVERLAAFCILERGGTAGNTAIVGMPSAAASPAASTNAGIGSRKTPGIDAIGCLWPSS